MNYHDYMQHIDKLSKKVNFSREEVSDILDYISLMMGFCFDPIDTECRDFVISAAKLNSIFNDLMIRFGPRSSDE